MSSLVLGLDIGPTSVGWALTDEASQEVVATGVRVFPEGVDRDQQGEKSKSQARREARAMRRQTARRAKRKRLLRQALTEAGLLPAEPETLEEILGENPYPLRRRALDERLEPYEIGRILLHLNQRRGFLSNRKTDRTGDREAKGMLKEIGELDQNIDASGARTLGEYLAGLNGSTPSDVRIRGQHTRREMLIHEFNKIWDAQRKHHPGILTDELKVGLYDPTSDADWVCKGLIFGQRRVYWPKTVVGRCELEPKHKRCERADRAAQRFRLLQEVNNLRYLDTETGEEMRLQDVDEQRTTLIDYLAAAKHRTFDQIRKKLGLPEDSTFNIERGGRSKLQGNQTDAALASSKALGKAWKSLDEATKDAIVRALIEEELEEEALARLTDECGLTAEQAQKALAAPLPEGHVNFSREAISKLLPHLERGLFLMADDETNSAIHAAGYLRPDERAVNQRDFLPPAPDLPNPIVRQALVEVRKVVNGIIREYGRPDRIHVELAREAKKSLSEREEIRFDNTKRRKAREKAAKTIARDHDFAPKGKDINRYMLWQEQEKLCPYCCEKIGWSSLFSADVDIDHILPRWRSLDNSLANQAVCHRRCNNEKGDRTPREWLEDEDPARYKRMGNTITQLPFNKRRKFSQRDIRLDDFVARQLTDTAYISRLASQYLRSLGAKIIVPRGQMTAKLRHVWGLDTILNPEGHSAKNRHDHRHHAVDALVIALIDHARLHALAKARGRAVPPPWGGLREQAEESILGITVSHRAIRQISGALHEKFFYGATQKQGAGSITPGSARRPWARGWTEAEGTFVRRKPVTGLTSTNHLNKIRDKAIRETLKEHLRDQGVDPDTPGEIPGDAFKGDNAPAMQSKQSNVPIKRVRMIERSDTFRQVSERRSYHWVKPGNNHHIVYWEIEADGAPIWEADVVSMWDAAQRARRNLPLVDREARQEARFVMSLSIGEMFQIDGDNGDRLLCVVRKLDQRSRRLDYKLHHDARKASEINQDNLYFSPNGMREVNAAKVAVDPLGRIRRAND